MGLVIELRDELGQQFASVDDRKNLLGRFLELSAAQKLPLLSGIDPYGDTYFNRLQMRRFLAEWQHLTAMAATEEERVILAAVEQLAEQCRSEMHLYLVFVGD